MPKLKHEKAIALDLWGAVAIPCGFDDPLGCGRGRRTGKSPMLSSRARVAFAKGLSAPRPALVLARGMAGAVKVTTINQEEIYGPATVDRTHDIIEMGVAYAPGVPSPMEGATTTFEPIVIDGLVVKTGGSSEFGRGLGCPVQYIKLSAWDTTPVDCKYTGLRFVSKKALAYAAKKA